jgi:L,D-peptidoglycan transpeptidase YkuD (ErfK/YbiS/YcfS/YnhG family)
VAVPRRRSFLFGGLVLTLGATLASSSWDGPAHTKDFSLPATRASLLGAVRVLRPEAPATARLLDHLVGDAEAITADERTAPSWERNPGRTEAAWARALLVANRGLADFQHRRATYGMRWDGLRAGVGADVRRALAESDEAGLGRREISAAKQANLKWELAERYAGAGYDDRAIAEAEQAQSFAAIVHQGFLTLHARFGERKNVLQWRQMVSETIARSRADGSTALIVDKLRRRLYVYRSGTRVASFEVELGAKGLKQKMFAGDQATPEGEYRVAQVKSERQTHYHRALLINYPNDADRARFSWGQRVGIVPRRAGIGSLIEIHGEGGQGRDWTDGCLALSNRDMERVFAEARLGMDVTIVGTF